MVPGGLAWSPSALECGLAGLDDHRVGRLDGEPFAGHLDDHLAAAGLFGRLVAGAGDVHAAERLLGLVQVDAEGGQGPRGGGVGVGQGGEQQVVGADRP